MQFGASSMQLAQLEPALEELGVKAASPTWGKAVDVRTERIVPNRSLPAHLPRE